MINKIEIELGPEEQPNSNGRSRTRNAWRKSIVCEAIWFTIVNAALIVGLIIDHGSDCDGHHLKEWAYLIIFLQCMMVFCSIFIRCNYPQTDPPTEESQRRLQKIAYFYLVSRLFNIFWVVWAITGIVWTFQANACVSKIPTLYTVCFILAIMHLILMGFPILIACCSIPIMIMIFVLCPGAVGRNPPRAASVRQIKQWTTLKKFSSDLMTKEDAICAICLSEYQLDEELRYLNCKHHFHADCITMWLKKNKFCPFCKKDIDYTDKQPQQTTEQTTEETTPVTVTVVPSEQTPQL